MNEFGIGMKIGRLAMGMNLLLKIVQYPDMVPLLDERIGRMGSDKTGAACDKYVHFSC